MVLLHEAPDQLVKINVGGTPMVCSVLCFPLPHYCIPPHFLPQLSFHHLSQYLFNSLLTSSVHHPQSTSQFPTLDMHIGSSFAALRRTASTSCALLQSCSPRSNSTRNESRKLPLMGVEAPSLAHTNPKSIPFP